MKKTFKFVFRPIIYILASIIAILLTVVVVINSLKLGGVGTFATVNFALDLSAVILAIALFIVMAIFIFGSCYTIKDDVLDYHLGFFRYRIRLKDIVVIREEKTTHTMVVNYKKIEKKKDDTEEGVYLDGIIINISNKRKDEFVSTLREVRHEILYELIDKNIED